MTGNTKGTAKAKAGNTVKDRRMAEHIVRADAKADTPALHKHAGPGSHKVSYDAKTGVHKADSDDAMADLHNPHKHAGIESYQLSHDAKADAKKIHGRAGAKVLKVPDEVKTRAHKVAKKGFVANIEEETKKNMDFRRVLYTGKNCQFVLMCLKPMEDIGSETHDDVDQFFRFEEGQGAVMIDGKKHAVKDGGGVIVPCGAEHNVINTSKTAFLKLYTIYSPPEHLDKVVRKTKQEALAKEEHFNGKTTE